MPSQQQLRKLKDALIDAFLDKSSLEQLLYYGLSKNLNEISRDSTLGVIVFELIKRAESEGWLFNLVHAAQAERPGNLSLQNIAQEILSNEDNITSVQPPKIPNDKGSSLSNRRFPLPALLKT